MTKALKAVARDVIPPVLYRGARSLLGKRASSTSSSVTVPVEGELKPAEWYDGVYGSSAKYSTHYVDSVYYPAWTVVADRIARSGAQCVLDLGCGPGQFAALLSDRGITAYRGLDFSKKSIELAQDHCPAYEFEQADISAPGVIESLGYDCVVSLEFLEHVEDDVGILRRIAEGTQVLATVPNYQSAGHVRIFSNEAEVLDRYLQLFTPCHVDRILLNPRGSTLFLIEGTKV
jgi:SAM-dependent methyltransferase